ncbi:hypothetical protein [Boseongicola sp. H5]|uniref:hypothetical protein n=1 Tax=Rhodobacterales TaxID=204455 RepID=UPI001B03934C|nr:hypothetical protein [Boseongicola sp. H5]MBO6602861.1 hypothetical protein [Roseicyclus sp.]MBO6625415.1 hypothetical protein [Roseicyclus sp.]MBO6923730.1 hypothetical protein [Roseicyclus sp.]
MAPKRPDTEMEAALFDFLTSRNAGTAVQKRLIRNYVDWQREVLAADAQLRMAELTPERNTDPENARQIRRVTYRAAINSLPI